MKAFSGYGWDRAYFLKPATYNRCEQGIQVVRDAFKRTQLAIAEWRQVDEDTLTDDVIGTVLTNIRERSRGTVSLTCAPKRFLC